MYLFKSTTKNWWEITNQVWNQNSWITTQNTANTTKDTENVSTTNSVSLWDIQTSWKSNTNTQKSNTNDWKNSTSLAPTNAEILPGTTEYLGTLDIVSILGQKPKITLQDSKWNYFAYYGNHLDFAETIETLWWNVYKMVTESEILQNQLFGDRVSYINLSSFKDVRVIMVIEIDEDVWLLQIPADKYHQSKDYLKSLFIH